MIPLFHIAPLFNDTDAAKYSTKKIALFNKWIQEYNPQIYSKEEFKEKFGEALKDSKEKTKHEDEEYTFFCDEGAGSSLLNTEGKFYEE